MYVSQPKSCYPNQLIQRTKPTTINRFPNTNFTSAKINIDTIDNLPVSLSLWIYIFWQQELLWWPYFLPAKQKFGPFHHNKQLFNLPTEHSLVQISAGFKDVGTKPQFSTLTFSRIVSILFWSRGSGPKFSILWCNPELFCRHQQSVFYFYLIAFLN